MAEMQIQLWSCKNCRKKGAVEHDEHADVYEVLYKIEDDHRRISPFCIFNRHMIQVQNLSSQERR